MDWSLIPEIYYDLIARIVPGSLLLLLAAIVQLGPRGWFDLATAKIPPANLASVLLFGIAAYFIAIVLSQIWDYLASVFGRSEDADAAKSRPLYRIRMQMPAEGSRLGKLQAEKNLCQVMIPGLALLAGLDLWVMATSPRALNVERVLLLVGMLLAFVACLGWKDSLERMYRQDWDTLSNLIVKQQETRRDC